MLLLHPGVKRALHGRLNRDMRDGVCIGRDFSGNGDAM